MNKKNTSTLTNILLVCITVLVFFSCDQGGKGTFLSGSTHKGELRKVGSLRIPLDSLTPFDVPSVSPCYRNDSLFLVMANSWAGTVDIYHRSGLYKRVQPGPTEGIFNVLQECSVRSADSIMVLFRFQLDKTRLVNLDGRLLNSRVINNPAYAGFNHMPRTLWQANFLYLLEGPLFDLKDMNRLAEFQWEYRYDLRTDRVEPMGITLPPAYVAQNLSNFWAIIPSRDLMSNRIMIYSWPASAELEFRSLKDFSVVRHVPAHVPEWGAVMLESVSSTGNETMGQQLEEALSHVLYWMVLYDPWRNVIYRIATIPSSAWEGQRLDDYYDFGLNHTGVIVLDVEGNLLGFRKFPPQTYWLFGFVGREGLYLSKANIYRDDFSEDWLEYDVFVFEPAGGRMRENDAAPGTR